MDKSLVGHIQGSENILDVTKNILYGQRRKYLVSNMLYDIHDEQLATNNLWGKVRSV